jgi:uncharacterized membrane protein
MSTMSIKPDTRSISLPSISRVEASRPFSWLKKGWADFLHDWPASLAAGAIFTLLGYSLLEYAWTRPHLTMTLTSGFVLVSPFLAIVFNDLSRRREGSSTRRLDGVRNNLASVGMFGLLLAFILSGWERISAIMVGLFLRNDPIIDGRLSFNLLLTPENMGFVIPYLLVGGALAALVFALSVVSLPMMIDRKVDIVSAIMTSLWVVRGNPLTMLVWAVVIGTLTLLGEALWFVGLAVVFPLLGHATWHAYRELVGPQ